MIWATTTPVRSREDLGELDPYTERIRARNEIAAALTKALGIPCNDLFALGLENPGYFREDGVHFNPQGIAAQAEVVAASIMELLEN